MFKILSIASGWMTCEIAGRTYLFSYLEDPLDSLMSALEALMDKSEEVIHIYFDSEENDYDFIMKLGGLSDSYENLDFELFKDKIINGEYIDNKLILITIENDVEISSTIIGSVKEFYEEMSKEYLKWEDEYLNDFFFNREEEVLYRFEKILAPKGNGAPLGNDKGNPLNKLRDDIVIRTTGLKSRFERHGEEWMIGFPNFEMLEDFMDTKGLNVSDDYELAKYIVTHSNYDGLNRAHIFSKKHIVSRTLV